MTPERRMRSTGVKAAVAGLGVTSALALMGFRTEISERVEPVQAEPKTTKSTRMAKGWEIILTAGQPGEARITSRRSAWWGIERGRIELSRTVTKKPKPELRMIGTATENPINAPKLTRVARSKKMVATGYDPGPHTNGW